MGAARFRSRAAGAGHRAPASTTTPVPTDVRGLAQTAPPWRSAPRCSAALSAIRSGAPRERPLLEVPERVRRGAVRWEPTRQRSLRSRPPLTAPKRIAAQVEPERCGRGRETVALYSDRSAEDWLTAMRFDETHCVPTAVRVERRSSVYPNRQPYRSSRALVNVGVTPWRSACSARRSTKPRSFAPGTIAIVHRDCPGERDRGLVSRASRRDRSRRGISRLRLDRRRHWPARSPCRSRKA